MREEKEQKELEECKFQPQLVTRKRGEQPRNMDKFLED